MRICMLVLLAVLLPLCGKADDSRSSESKDSSKSTAVRRCFRDKDKDGKCDRSRNDGGRCSRNCTSKPPEKDAEASES